LKNLPAGDGFADNTSWALGQGGEQVAEFSVSGSTSTWKHSNVYAGGKLLGTYDGKGLHFYLDDWLGTRRIQTNALGQLELTCQSLPYGNGENCIATALSTAEDPTEQHFTGKERDAESGNDYFEARYYSSAAGRFLSPDWSAKEEPVPYARLDNPQTLNLYAYLSNNPLAGIDADGHGPNDQPCGGIQVQVKKDADPHPMPNTGPITTADGKKQYITGVGTTTVSFSKDGKPVAGLSVKESPVTTNIVLGGPAKESANPNTVPTSFSGTITDVGMQPMIGTPQPRADFATSEGRAAINNVANGVPVLKQIDQNLSFSVPGPNGQSMSCTASYTQTLGNANPQGAIANPTNSSGSNFTYTTTQPKVTQANP
jgi:RHS repeat-associated protein